MTTSGKVFCTSGLFLMLAACQGTGGTHYVPSTAAVAMLEKAGLERDAGGSRPMFYCEPPRCRSDMSVSFLSVSVSEMDSFAGLPTSDEAAQRMRAGGERLKASGGGVIAHFRTRNGEPGFTITTTTRLKSTATGELYSYTHFQTHTHIHGLSGPRSVIAIVTDRPTSVRFGSRNMIER